MGSRTWCAGSVAAMNDRKTWLVVSGGSTDTEVPAGWPTGHSALPGVVQAALFAAASDLPVKALLAPGVPTRREACEKLHAALAESQKREAALREQNERMRKVIDMIALETSIAVGRAIDANRDVVVLVEDPAQAAREQPIVDPDNGDGSTENTEAEAAPVTAQEEPVEDLPEEPEWEGNGSFAPTVSWSGSAVATLENPCVAPFVKALGSPYSMTGAAVSWNFPNGIVEIYRFRCEPTLKIWKVPVGGRVDDMKLITSCEVRPDNVNDAVRVALEWVNRSAGSGR